LSRIEANCGDLKLQIINIWNEKKRPISLARVGRNIQSSFMVKDG
jgi:hypothetical protein